MSPPTEVLTSMRGYAGMSEPGLLALRVTQSRFSELLSRSGRQYVSAVQCAVKTSPQRPGVLSSTKLLVAFGGTAEEFGALDL